MITIDAVGPIPPSEQIRTQLAGLIRSGELAAGTRLPSIRQIAADLRVAPGTVAKAYAELDAAGLIESNRALGSRVRPQQAVPAAARGAAQGFIAAALKAGLAEDEAVELVRSLWVSEAGRR